MLCFPVPVRRIAHGGEWRGLLLLCFALHRMDGMEGGDVCG